MPLRDRLRRSQRRRRGDCAEVRELFSDYVDGELDREGKDRVEEHVGLCAPCRSVLTNLRCTLLQLQRLLGRRLPPTDDERRIAQRMRRPWLTESDPRSER